MAIPSPDFDLEVSGSDGSSGEDVAAEREPGRGVTLKSEAHGFMIRVTKVLSQINGKWCSDSELNIGYSNDVLRDHVHVINMGIVAKDPGIRTPTR